MNKFLSILLTLALINSGWIGCRGADEAALIDDNNQLDDGTGDEDTEECENDDCEVEKEVPLIHMFSTRVSDGSIGGRDGSKKLCEDAVPTNLQGKVVEAFISIAETDSIAEMPANYKISTTSAIVGPTEIQIAKNWEDLLDGKIEVPLSEAQVVGVDAYFISGSKLDGKYDSSFDNCGNFGLEFGNVVHGGGNTVTGWLAVRTGGLCKANTYLLCVAYDRVE